MLSHRNFRAWITSEGNKLAIYEPHLEPGKNTVTCWIPAEAGKNFAVNWEDQGTGIDSAAYITLDGFKVPGRYLFGRGIAWRTGVRTGPTTERPFAFGAVDGGAPPKIQGDVKADQFGMIVLRIRQIARSDSHSPNPVRPLPNSMKGENRFSLCVKLGPEIPCSVQPAETWDFKPHDKEHPNSFVTFIFRYRSPDFLAAQGLQLMEMKSVGNLVNTITPLRNSGKRKLLTDDDLSRTSTPIPLETDRRASLKRQRTASTLIPTPCSSQRTDDGRLATSSSTPTPSDSLLQLFPETNEATSYPSDIRAIVAALEPYASSYVGPG